MGSFTVEIVPPLPAVGADSKRLSYDDLENIRIESLDFERIYSHHTEEYDVRYHVGGRVFAYYPSSIVTVLNDLYQEWEFVSSRTPHTMTLCGYTVLEVDFKEEEAIFLDPVAYHRTGTRELISEPVSAAVVEQAFRSAVVGVLRVIESTS